MQLHPTPFITSSSFYAFQPFISFSSFPSLLCSVPPPQKTIPAFCHLPSPSPYTLQLSLPKLLPAFHLIQGYTRIEGDCKKLGGLLASALGRESLTIFPPRHQLIYNLLLKLLIVFASATSSLFRSSATLFVNQFSSVSFLNLNLCFYPLLAVLTCFQIQNFTYVILAYNSNPFEDFGTITSHSS